MVVDHHQTTQVTQVTDPSEAVVMAIAAAREEMAPLVVVIVVAAALEEEILVQEATLAIDLVQILVQELVREQVQMIPTHLLAPPHLLPKPRESLQV